MPQLTAATLCTQAPSYATTIERVVSPGGIEAWLVREPSIPLVSMDFSFRSSSGPGPADKRSVGYFTTGVLDDGAGDLNADAFHKLEETAIELRFSTARSHVQGSIRML